jgi:hypothetical protein
VGGAYGCCRCHFFELQERQQVWVSVRADQVLRKDTNEMSIRLLDAVVGVSCAPLETDKINQLGMFRAANPMAASVPIGQ